MRPVLYLDIDDTLLSWADAQPRPVPETGPFLLWALHRFEVRWLTRWCPSGEMADHLVRDLAGMAGVDIATLRSIRGCAWEESEAKVDGIAWLEHVVLGRDFYWVENREGLTARDFEVLEQAGYMDRYVPCNITLDQTALARVRRMLERRFARRLPGTTEREDVA